MGVKTHRGRLQVDLECWMLGNPLRQIINQLVDCRAQTVVQHGRTQIADHLAQVIRYELLAFFESSHLTKRRLAHEESSQLVEHLVVQAACQRSALLFLPLDIRLIKRVQKLSVGDVNQARWRSGWRWFVKRLFQI